MLELADAELSPHTEGLRVATKRLRAAHLIEELSESPFSKTKKSLILDLLCASGLEGTTDLYAVTGETPPDTEAALEGLGDSLKEHMGHLIENVVGHMTHFVNKLKTHIVDGFEHLNEKVNAIKPAMWEKVENSKEYVKTHPIKAIAIGLSIIAAAAVAIPAFAELPGIASGVKGFNTWAGKIAETLKKIPVVGPAGDWSVTKVKGLIHIKFPGRAALEKLFGEERVARATYKAGILRKAMREIGKVIRIIFTVLTYIGKTFGKLVHAYVTKFVKPMYSGVGKTTDYVMKSTGKASLGLAAGGFVWTWITSLNLILVGGLTYYVLNVVGYIMNRVKEGMRYVGLMGPVNPDAEYAGGEDDGF